MDDVVAHSGGDKDAQTHEGRDDHEPSLAPCCDHAREKPSRSSDEDEPRPTTDPQCSRHTRRHGDRNHADVRCDGLLAMAMLRPWHEV